jgi:hypothetical protein
MLSSHPSSSADPSGSGANTLSPTWPWGPIVQWVRLPSVSSYFTMVSKSPMRRSGWRNADR